MWFIRASEAGMLWLTGKEGEAAMLSEKVLECVPEDVGPDTVRMLLMVMAAHPSTEKNGDALNVLVTWRNAPTLARNSKDHHWQDEEESRVAAFRYITNLLADIKGSVDPWYTPEGIKTMMWNITRLVCKSFHFPRGIGGPADPPMPDPFRGMIDDISIKKCALKNLAGVRECAQCGEKGEKLRRCKQCRSVWYCSAACARAHWVSPDGHSIACRHSAAVVGVAGAAAAAVVRGRLADATDRVAAAIAVAVAAAAVAMLVHRPGSAVEAHSLSSVALNGLLGRVVGTQGDRVQVDFGASGRKALRPINLRLAVALPADDSGG